MGAVPPGAMILDFGPDSVADLKRRLGAIRTVLWNGPLGAFETAPFGEATFAIAREVARLTKEDKLVSVAGGGDTVRALNEAHVAGDFSYVSTAGGAFLEWLGGAQLPGVAGACPQRRPRLGLAQTPVMAGRFSSTCHSRESGNPVYTVNSQLSAIKPGVTGLPGQAGQ